MPARLRQIEQMSTDDLSLSLHLYEMDVLIIMHKYITIYQAIPQRGNFKIIQQVNRSISFYIFWDIKSTTCLTSQPQNANVHAATWISSSIPGKISWQSKISFSVSIAFWRESNT